MNTFQDWYQRHAARFAGVKRLVETDPTIYDDWERMLSKFSIESLDHATDQIMISEKQPFPEEHLGKIRVFATAYGNNKKLKNSVAYDDHRRVKCAACQDRGTLRVYDWRSKNETGGRGTYLAIANNEFNPEDIRDFVVACDCEAGNQHRQEVDPGRKGACKPLPKYDPDFMRQVVAISRDDQASELVGFVLNNPTVYNRPAGYHQEFSSFE